MGTMAENNATKCSSCDNCDAMVILVILVMGQGFMSVDRRDTVFAEPDRV